MQIDQRTLKNQFILIRAQKESDGVWLKADAELVEQSIRAALASGDAERIQGAVDYLQAEAAPIEQMHKRVRDANTRMQQAAQAKRDAMKMQPQRRRTA